MFQMLADEQVKYAQMLPEEQLRYIADHIPSSPALFEMLAEEATELAHASLKIARKLRGENPTPIGYEEAYSQLVEEWGDLILVQKVLSFDAQYAEMKRKADRWVERLKEKEAADVHPDAEC